MKQPWLYSGPCTCSCRTARPRAPGRARSTPAHRTPGLRRWCGDGQPSSACAAYARPVTVAVGALCAAGAAPFPASEVVEDQGRGFGHQSPPKQGSTSNAGGMSGTGHPSNKARSHSTRSQNISAASPPTTPPQTPTKHSAESPHHPPHPARTPTPPGSPTSASHRPSSRPHLHPTRESPGPHRAEK